MTVFRRRSGASWRVLGGAPILPVAPSAPRVVGVVPADEALTIAWEPAFAGGSAITGYTATANPGSHTASVGGGATTATVTGLTNGTEYTVTMTATNAVGTSLASASIAATPVAGVIVRPDASTTGVPDGVTLTPSGGLTITTSGTYSGLDITGGVKIDANNVTLRNFRITYGGALYALQVTSGKTGVIVEDGEVNAGVGNSASAAIYAQSGILQRLDVHGGKDAVKLAGTAMLQTSWVHDMDHSDPASHCDCVQVTAGSGVTVRRNNLEAFNAGETPVPANASVQIGAQSGPLTNLIVEDNWMDGGNYTINHNNGKQSTHGAITGAYRRNRFGLLARYGPVTSLPAGMTFDNTNVWDESGTTTTGKVVVADTAVK